MIKMTNLINENDESLLHQARRNNNLEMVELLISNGADVNVFDKNNKPPLYWACYHNNLKW
jgi:ankyrin repeat protein